ncbi:MAG: YCF48-related protein [Fluviicola sp.]
MKTFITIMLSGAFIISTNGLQAQSWWPQNSGSGERLQSVNFFNNSQGYLFGDTLSTVISTSSSGSVWSNSNVAFTDGDLRSSAITNASTVYAVGVHDVPGGTGLVLKSSNSGATWSVDTTITEDLFDVSFPSGNTGYISGENGYVAKTTNAGLNWTALNTGTGEDLFAITFVSDNEGWAVGTADPNAVIYHTNDGGASWGLQNSGSLEPLFSVDFVDNQNGWAVGAAGSIVYTTDGGANWVAQVSGTNQDLFDIDMLDQNNGWAVGAGGTVLRTNDGGVNWVAEVSGTTNDLLSIHMQAIWLGWICGADGEVRVYGTNPPNVGINELVTDFSVFPIPASKELLVKYDEPITAYKISDIQNKVVVADNMVGAQQFVIDVHDLRPGTYFLHIETEAVQKQPRRIIIQ